MTTDFSAYVAALPARKEAVASLVAGLPARVVEKAKTIELEKPSRERVLIAAAIVTAFTAGCVIGHLVATSRAAGCCDGDCTEECCTSAE